MKELDGEGGEERECERERGRERGRERVRTKEREEERRGIEGDRKRETQQVRQRLHPTRMPSLTDVVQSLAPLQAITLA